MADDDFERQIDQIDHNYRSIINKLLDEARRVDDEETVAAKALSEKHGVTLKPRYYDEDN